jgi:serpin B
MDLYFDLSKTNTENLFFSPYSIYSALAMTYEGANGATAEEMKNVFYFPENNVLRPNSAAIYNKLNTKNKNYEIRTGNALWVSKDLKLLDNYSQNVEKYYGGKAVNLDFVNETEKSRLTINDFIAKQTNNRIKNILEDLSSDTKLILTNAIYFKGKWIYEFNKKDTTDLDFKITPENVVQIETMVMLPKKTKFNYLNNDYLKMLELNYLGNDLSMLILLPKDNLDTLDEILTIDKLNEWKSEMKDIYLTKITLPKFEFDDKMTLSNNLSTLGMSLAFSDSANFSKMSDESLMISKVIHQSFISVDESGTEAAAATVVTMIATSVGPGSQQEVFEFIADHPFIFIIQDKQTGEILFLGRIVNPSS